MLNLQSQVAGLSPSLLAVECNPGQVANICASVTKQYNLVPANVWWCHASHISGSPPTGSRPRRGRWAPAYALLVEYGKLYLTFTWSYHCQHTYP